MNSYDALAYLYEETVDDVLHAIYIDIIQRYHKKGHLLEIGCGTGTIARELVRCGIQVDAFDLSDAMIERAIAYNASEPSRVNFYKHDVRHPFKGSFDTIVMPVDVLNHLESFDDVVLAFNHIHTALKHHGILIFDLLHLDYMQGLIGYEERIITDQIDMVWSVEATSKKESIQHCIDYQGKRYTHTEQYYDEPDVLRCLKNYDLLERIDLDERSILILKKKEE